MFNCFPSIGLPEVPTRAPELFPRYWEGLCPIQKEENMGFLPWQVALPGLGGLPAPSHCQVYCPAAEQEFGLPQLPAEQMISSLREISLDEARQPVQRAAWKNPDSGEPSNEEWDSSSFAMLLQSARTCLSPPPHSPFMQWSLSFHQFLALVLNTSAFHLHWRENSRIRERAWTSRDGKFWLTELC